LVAEAVEVAFADFLDKVDSHPIGDSHLESALMRSTRLTAAEAAWVDWDEPSAPKGGRSPSFGGWSCSHTDNTAHGGACDEGERWDRTGGPGVRGEK